MKKKLKMKKKKHFFARFFLKIFLKKKRKMKNEKIGKIFFFAKTKKTENKYFFNTNGAKLCNLQHFCKSAPLRSIFVRNALQSGIYTLQ